MLRKQLAKLNHLMQGIEKVYADYAKSVGITYMSLTVLQIICYADMPQTQKEICEMTHYNKQIVNTIVKGFHEKGYLIFEEVLSDRRNKYVCLTDSGKAYADDILKPLSMIEEKALSVLSQEEWNMGLQILDRCYEGYREAVK